LHSFIDKNRLHHSYC